MIFKEIIIHTWTTSDGHTPTLRERANMRKMCGPYHLTPFDIDAELRKTHKQFGRGFYQSSRGLMVGDDTFSLRLSEANQHLESYTRLSRINGYYCDHDGDSTLQPIVARLNHNRGFLAGWTMGAGLCGAIDYDIYPTAEDAARAAHSMAEYDAQREREYQAENDENDSETSGVSE